MKSAIGIIMIILMIFLISSVGIAFADEKGYNQNEPDLTERAGITDLYEFIESFNSAADVFMTGHRFSIDDADEISDLYKTTLVKKVFNGCEILSVMLSKGTTNIQGIHCTYAYGVAMDSVHASDYWNLLFETLCACKIATEEGFSITDFMSNIGFTDHHEIGDSGEVVIEGLKINYSINKGTGVTFSITLSM